MICVHLDKLRGFEVEKRSAGRNTVSSMCATLVASTWYLRIVVAGHVPGFSGFFSFSQDAYSTSALVWTRVVELHHVASLPAFVTLQSPPQFETRIFCHTEVMKTLWKMDLTRQLNAIWGSHPVPSISWNRLSKIGNQLRWIPRSCSGNIPIDIRSKWWFL